MRKLTEARSSRGVVITTPDAIKSIMLKFVDTVKVGVDLGKALDGPGSLPGEIREKLVAKQTLFSVRVSFDFEGVVSV